MFKKYFYVLLSLNTLYLPLKYISKVCKGKKIMRKQLQRKLTTFSMNYLKLLFSFDNERKSFRAPAEHPLIMS